jgi:hypothetical protein
MPVGTVVLVPVWHEAAHLFSAQELAALAWAEEVTRVSETHASDGAYAARAAALLEKDLVDLTLAIAAMNAINRLGISVRLKPRAKADAWGTVLRLEAGRALGMSESPCASGLCITEPSAQRKSA